MNVAELIADEAYHCVECIEDGGVETWANRVAARIEREAGGPPPCPDHQERQHRDTQPPWCDLCGWSRGVTVPARKCR